MSLKKLLNPEKALIFRITHCDNIPWILDHGLHCRNSDVLDPAFVTIGKEDLIDRRTRWKVPEPPGGKLADYVPFYFTPFSPMFLKIKTGHNGIRERPNDQVVILVSSLHELTRQGVTFLFTDQHACMTAAQFSCDLADLNRIRWDLLQTRDFRRDDNDLEKFEKYQAEALAYRHVPVNALLGIACYTHDVKNTLDDAVAQRGLTLKTPVRPDWYF